MNKKDWYKSLNLVEDKFIEEANPNKKAKPKLIKIFGSAIAACAALALLFGNLWLFIPFSTEPPEMREYANSEYYDIIKKFNAFTFVNPKYKNNAEKLLAELAERGEATTDDFWASENGSLKEEIWIDSDEGDLAGDGADYYQEITDNQVEGIIEADRIKRSNKYIYYLDKNVLRIYSIDKENTKELDNYPLYVPSALEGAVSHNQWEFYLSNDCKTVTVITQCYEESNTIYNNYVKLISLDVSDPSNIIKKDELSISGRYSSSRITNGSILLLTQYSVNLNKLDFNNETTFIPQITDENGSHCISASSIVSPDVLNNTCYTVVAKLDENTLDLQGTAAYLSYSDKLYVSENHIFLTREFSDDTENTDDTLTRTTKTEISCLSYCGEEFKVKGNITINGYIKDQWSMDEYNNVLRVFTTTSNNILEEKPIYYEGTKSYYYTRRSQKTNASLYCIDLSNFKVSASVIDFAPPNETIRSVRFDKNTAYVCTSVQLTDPVFFFDLSDLKNITYKDTGTIEGFSTSLINLGNGYLCGIGRGDGWDTFKVEIYEETQDGVRSVCSYELDGIEYSTNYKSYYIDRKNQLIGVGLIDCKNYTSYNTKTIYLVLHFNNGKLTDVVNTPLAGDINNMRGVYIDGYMYMFGENDFKVQKVFN